MCTVIVLRRRHHRWPVLVAANRDEMRDRPWQPPGRHWNDRFDVVAGRDELAGGTWLALNDDGVMAAVLNRRHSLGPAEGFRSRGELPLEAVDHADASDAVTALAALDAGSYRPFNMVIADNRDAFWLRADGRTVQAFPLSEGISMITAYDCNDIQSPRIGRYLPRFIEASPPRPEHGDWASWQALLASRQTDDMAQELTGEGGPAAAMTVVTTGGFGTVSSSLLALPASPVERPIWLFASGRPDLSPFLPVDLMPPPR